MKYFRFLLLFISMMMVSLSQAQTICVYKSGSIIQEFNVSEVDSVVYAPKQVISTTSLTLSSSSLSFKVGGVTQSLTATRNIGANDNAQLIWSSSDTNVVTVAGNGPECTVAPVGEGSATIKVYVSGKESTVYATCNVTVSVAIKPTTTLTLNKSSLTLIPNETQTLTATRNVDANDNAQILWKSSAPSVATVSNLGVVEGKTDGKCTITAYISGKESSVYANCNVTVKSPVVEPTGNILIGDICLGAKPSGSPLNDINSILSEDVVRQNISKGNLREFVLTEKLSEVLRSETNSDGVLEISQWRTMKFQTSPTSEAYSYHGVLIPSSLANEYIGVFVDGMNFGTSFDLVIPGCTSITNKTITYNGIEYTIFAYYVANTYMKDAAYISTIIKK